ncbi:MAG: T9SS type A sorting domain-containing protein [Ignavibacteriae bacterium]|nr:T9SS type A sorting domain-containing protein [Ignavibacteriota bacterium]
MMSFRSATDTLSNNRLFQTLRHVHRAFPFLILALFTSSASAQKWVGTWSTPEQLVEPGNNPPSPGLTNNTLRQILRVSIGGDSLRMKFSNEFSTQAVTLNAVHIAISMGGGIIDSSTDRELRFSGNPSITMAPGAAVMSDPFQFALPPLTDVAITIYFGGTSTSVTGHPGSRTTSYLLTGNQVTRVNFSAAVRTDHWYVINTIDVLAPDTAAAVVMLGNSITDGRGSGTNLQNRWPDEVARRLQANTGTRHVAVLNQGIGGNCVLRTCLGPSAVSRFQRDVIGQRGVKWLIILEGINDIGGASGSGIGNNLISAYRQMIDTAHAHGILVYGATLLPMGGSSYYSTAHEAERQIVNQWIRTSGAFDAVIDFDVAMRDSNNPINLRPDGDSGDHLHPNETGHRIMGEAVDLNLFASSATGVDNAMEAPEGFVLRQNYPNPFNPSTTIRYALTPVPSPSGRGEKVSLKVYDLLGREVATLVNEIKQPGEHTVQWNTEELASGVYFYRMMAGSYVQTRKLVLQK